MISENWLQILSKSLWIIVAFLSLNVWAQFEPKWEGRRQDFPFKFHQESTLDSKLSTTAPTYLRFEHRLILAYLLESTGMSEKNKISLAKKMEKSMNSLAQRSIDWIKVDSFDEYISFQKAEWPNTHRLSFDLKIIERRIEVNHNLKIKMYYSQEPSVQNQILLQNFKSSKYFIQLLKENKAPITRGLVDFSLKSLKLLEENIRNLPSSMSEILNRSLTFLSSTKLEFPTLENINQSQKHLFSQISQELILQAFSASESLLNSFMRETETIIGNVLKELKGIGLHPGEKRALEILFRGYFKEMSLESKKLMLNALLELPINSDIYDKFGLMLQLSDPVFQKCMQLFARVENMPLQLGKIFQSLESSIRPVPWFLVESILEIELKKYAIVNVSKTPIGVGTQRQYHLGQLQLSSGERVDVVIGILKPDIERRVTEGESIIKKLAPKVDGDPLVQESGLPRLETFIPDTMRFIRIEQDADYVRTMQSKFFNVYQRYDNNVLKDYGIQLQFLAPKVYEPNEGRSNLLVQEFVRGDKIDDAINKSDLKIPELKKILAEQLFILWFRELIFGSGFYHGDLHHGNLKVHINTKLIKFAIIDYGMAGQLSLKGRSQLIKLGASIELLEAKTMSSIFWDMRDPQLTKISKKNLFKVIDSKIQVEGAMASREMDEWIKFTAKFGLKLQTEFMDMMRGFITVKNLISEVQSEISSNEEAKKLALRHPLKGALVTLFGSIQTRSPNFWKMSGLIFDTYQKTQKEAEALESVSRYSKEFEGIRFRNQCKQIFQ